jgi:hypothetical protein
MKIEHLKLKQQAMTVLNSRCNCFLLADWFLGFPVESSDIIRYGRQPSDDGQADEDCVELRRHFSLPEKGYDVTSTFFWNDRNCQQLNPYVCQSKCFLQSLFSLNLVYFVW